jgi:hypothetical protein
VAPECELNAQNDQNSAELKAQNDGNAHYAMIERNSDAAAGRA